MCTVTIIPLPAAPEGGGPGYRLKVNRDELRTRPEASPPVWRDVSPGRRGGPSRRAIYPVDPKGGGTWVAAAPSGLAMAILNLNLTPPPALPADLISRGAIIPGLVGHRRIEEVLGALEKMDLERYKPFRLIVMDLERVEQREGGTRLRPVEAAWDRESLQVRAHETDAACWASSGLGDAIVQVRLPLWERSVAMAGAVEEVQDAFHAHRWPERLHQSVLMSRSDARTVSITTVEVRAGVVEGGGMEEGGGGEGGRLEAGVPGAGRLGAGGPEERGRLEAGGPGGESRLEAGVPDVRMWYEAVEEVASEGAGGAVEQVIRMRRAPARAAKG